MTHYYDLVLGIIPLVLAGVSGLLVALGMATTAAVTIAGVAAIAVIAHAMFVRTPGATAQTGSTHDSATATYQSSD